MHFCESYFSKLEKKKTNEVVLSAYYRIDSKQERVASHIRHLLRMYWVETNNPLLKIFDCFLKKIFIEVWLICNVV